MLTELERNLAQRYTVADMFRRNARHAPEKVALVEKRGEKAFRLTYRQLNEKINQFARGLRSLGYRRGDRIAVLGLNSWEFLIAVFGCARGGFVVVPLNPGMGPKDLVYMINHSESRALVADDIFSPYIDGMREQCGDVKDYIAMPVSGSDFSDYFLPFEPFLEEQAGEEVEEIIWERDAFGIYYTSGTTSRPKGTVVSHLAMLMMTMTNMMEMGLQRGLTIGMVLPAFHAAQHGANTAAFMAEGKVVVFRAFDPEALLEAIEEERIQHLLLLPILWRALLECPRREEFDCSSLTYGLYGMAPMDRPTLEGLIHTFTQNFSLGTGQTEFIPSSENFKKEWQLVKKGNYWGEPAITVETAIMDEAGNMLPQGEIGEIVRRGPGTLTEYLKNPEATAEKMKYGWAHSEDIGYFDEDGLLVFVDRKKDMIKTGGENVPSVKVEQVVLSHPAVSEVAAVGLPHERWSEAITAFVVPRQGVEVTEREIIDFCKEELGRFEVPKKVVFLDAMPKTSSGKIRKNLLKEEHQGLYLGGC